MSSPVIGGGYVVIRGTPGREGQTCLVNPRVHIPGQKCQLISMGDARASDRVGPWYVEDHRSAVRISFILIATIGKSLAHAEDGAHRLCCFAEPVQSLTSSTAT